MEPAERGHKRKDHGCQMDVSARNDRGARRSGDWVRLLWAGAIMAGFALTLAVLGAWLRFEIAGRGGMPAYVVRIALPDGRGAIGLPPVEGPADASRPLVVIDAGHGGHDPGASGPGGEHEKTLTLALALAVRDALLADGHVRVALTRSDDRFLALSERSGMARRLHADVFLSIHADAADAPDAAGATVYTLSDTGSGALADAVAARENRVDTINGVSLDGKDDAVSQFLVDLSQQRMRRNSQDFAALIRREGEGHMRFRDVPLQQAAFVVLKSLDLPSALLEAGYVSNPADVRAMTSRPWRDGFGRAVAHAIEIFLAGGGGA
ncbi:N-acetylmuramoyl-L-alanine amidase [Novosphingobium sp. Fuku2-ISO-50]|nr:N-acetylmuramoyl-L-alanine amidase [Novosphingobium sp. Fuku2-ISO-50]